MGDMSVRRSQFGRTYAMPVVIAVISTAGLLVALIGDGLWDYLSWLALGLPVAVGGWFSVCRGGRPNLRRRRSCSAIQ
jgi:hypothetical protein